ALRGQTDFHPGYIILLDGDTLRGEIDYRGDLLMSSVCKFRNNANLITDYSPGDLRAFRFTDSKYYLSGQIDQKRFFMKCLIVGTVSIYYSKDENGDHYYIDKENIGLTEIEYEEGIRYIKDKRVFYQTKFHYGILNYYMQDVPTLQSKIRGIKKPYYKNLTKLAKDYHKEIGAEDQYTIYENSAGKVRINPEFVLGTIRYTVRDALSGELTDNRYYIHGGFLGHFWMPKTNEKLYLRMGVLVSKPLAEYSTLYKIPLQIEYISPKGILRPRIAYGLNFYSLLYQTVSFNAGVNIQLSDTYYISATTDIEYTSTLLAFPNTIFSYSMKIGLFMDIR
ncbi:MAG: hypothetical protein WBA74_26495, partial [Cyclobacteriaceae bacterium]